jgi:putative transposase
MGRPPLNIDVAKKDQRELRTLLKGGVQQVRVVLRALALLQLAESASAPQISKVVPLTPQAIRRLGHRYQQAGLDGALYEKQRPGAAEVLDANQKQRIIAMVCSDPPAGRARWTVRLVAEEAVKRKLAPQVGRETIRILLLHHDFKPWWSAWTKSRLPYTPMSGRLPRPYQVGKPDGTTNTSDAAQPMFSVR